MSSQTNGYPTNIRYFVYLFVWLILWSLPHCAQARWKSVAPGIEYQDLEGGLLTPWSHIHVFRIDLAKNKLSLVTAKSLGLNNASVEQFSAHTKGLIAINGGFFDHKFRPLGLRINQHHLENPLKPISWWGIFYTKHHKAHVTNVKHFETSDSIDFAVQSGPRLLIKGKIPSLKPGLADRTALGITKQGQIILLVSTNSVMHTQELAKLLKSPPLSCVDAINLDGGSSSQLEATMNLLKLKVRGYSNVSDAIVVNSI